MGIPRAQPLDQDRSVSRAWPWAVVIAVAAFLFRLVPVLRGVGLFGFGNYDDGVYYASAIGLIHGLLPYQDFVLLHPPAITLLLAPFAAVAQLTSDSYGFATARVARMLLGAANAVLIGKGCTCSSSRCCSRTSQASPQLRSLSQQARRSAA